jgi:hypothetical protein
MISGEISEPSTPGDLIVMGDGDVVVMMTAIVMMVVMVMVMVMMVVMVMVMMVMMVVVVMVVVVVMMNDVRGTDVPPDRLPDTGANGSDDGTHR